MGDVGEAVAPRPQFQEVDEPAVADDIVLEEQDLYEEQAGAEGEITEAYEVRWIPTWARILDVPTNRHKELLRGMRTTLERLKTTAEAQA